MDWNELQSLTWPGYARKNGAKGIRNRVLVRELNPYPYLYYFNYGEFEVIGSSPEMIVKQQGSRVYTCPIAGTRRRGVDAEEDALLRDELLRDEKERADESW